MELDSMFKRKENWVKASELLNWAKNLCPVEPFAKELEEFNVEELERTSFNTGFIVGLLLCKWVLFVRREESAAKNIKEFLDKLLK